MNGRFRGLLCAGAAAAMLTGAPAQAQRRRSFPTPLWGGSAGSWSGI